MAAMAVVPFSRKAGVNFQPDFLIECGFMPIQSAILIAFGKSPGYSDLRERYSCFLIPSFLMFVLTAPCRHQRYLPTCEYG
jgi:hypothetical protein